jgi:P-type Ca2+ transporter type 2B
VLWGRNIYDSIRKFVQFQLTVNVVAVLCTLIGAAAFENEILKPIQMLWINLIMDTLASLALATEDPEESLLERGPHSRDEYIISKTMLKHIIGQSIYQMIVMMALVFLGEFFIPEFLDSYDSDPAVFANHPECKWHNGIIGGTVRSGRLFYANGGNDYEDVLVTYGIYSRHFTVIFNAFVMMQAFNFLNARKLHEEVFFLRFRSTSSTASPRTPSFSALSSPSSSFRSSWSPSLARPSVFTATMVSPSNSGASAYFFIDSDCVRSWFPRC